MWAPACKRISWPGSSGTHLPLPSKASVEKAVHTSYRCGSGYSIILYPPIPGIWKFSVSKNRRFSLGKISFKELPVPVNWKNQRIAYFGYLKKKSVSKNGQFQVFGKKISSKEPPGFMKELAKAWRFEVDILFLSKNLRAAVIYHKRVFDFWSPWLSTLTHGLIPSEGLVQFLIPAHSGSYQCCMVLWIIFQNQRTAGSGSLKKNSELKNCQVQLFQKP